MDRHFLRNTGLGLIEIAIGLSVATVLLLAVLPLGKQAIANARLVQNHRNLSAVAQACRQYYMQLGHWPGQVADLQPYFLSAGVDGQGYVLNPQVNILTVSWGNHEVTVIKPGHNSLSFPL